MVISYITFGMLIGAGLFTLIDDLAHVITFMV